MCLLALFGCFVLTYAVGSINGKQAEQRHAQPHAHGETAKSDAKRTCVGTDPATVFECVYDKVEASEDTARTEEDLTAQQRAAWGAMLGAGVAFLTMGISAVGLWFIYETLEATRATVREANDATDAAKEAVNVAKDSSEKQLRAYVSVESVKVTHISPGFAHSYVRIVNLGPTPAKITKVVAKAWVGPRDILYPVDDGPEVGMIVVHKKGLGRDQADDILVRIEPEDIPRLNTSDSDVYIYGIVDYEDVFGRPQNTAFAYTPAGYSVTVGDEFIPCVFGNSAT